jgi:hypothetical protein
MLDLDDVRWELGRFGKLNDRYGKGSRRKGPKPRLVPLITARTATCAGSSRTCGATSTPTTPGRGPAVPRRNARAGMAPAPGRPPRCSAGHWPRPRPSTFDLAREAHPARAAALLRQPALPRRHEPVRHPGAPRPRLDWHHSPVHQLSGIASDGREPAGRLLSASVPRGWGAACLRQCPARTCSTEARHALRTSTRHHGEL